MIYFIYSLEDSENINIPLLVSNSRPVVFKMYSANPFREQFPGDPWLHFCNGYFEVYYFLN
jgi:hypothetical protein